MRDDSASGAIAPYRAPAWLRGGHAQTIWPSFMRLPTVATRRERVEIGDGDFWDFDWLATPADAHAPLVVLFHGLEGGATSPYAVADMVDRTSTEIAPWTLVEAEDKHFARIKVLRTIVKALETAL